jgi:hypothetical protein
VTACKARLGLTMRRFPKQAGDDCPGVGWGPAHRPWALWCVLASLLASFSRHRCMAVWRGHNGGWHGDRDWHGRDGAGMAIGTGTAVATGVWRNVASLSALRRPQDRHGWSSGISSVTPPEPPRRLRQASGTTDAM